MAHFAASQQSDWSWMQDVSFTGVTGKLYAVSGDLVFSDGAAGHLVTFPVGPPGAGDLDVLLVKPNPVSATVSPPVSAAGAPWQLKVLLAGAYSGCWRVAGGSEPADVLITTSANVRTFVHWSRWR